MQEVGHALDSPWRRNRSVAPRHIEQKGNLGENPRQQFKPRDEQTKISMSAMSGLIANSLYCETDQGTDLSGRERRRNTSCLTSDLQVYCQHLGVHLGPGL